MTNSEIQDLFVTCLSQYQKFRKENNPPIELSVMNGMHRASAMLAVTIPPNKQGGLYQLKIDEVLFNKGKSEIKQVLFHEFTHIYDDAQTTEYVNGKPIRICESYSEINASKIELMSAFGFNSISQIKYVGLNDCLWKDGNKITLSEFFLKACNKITVIPATTVGISSDELSKIEAKQILYCIGFLSFIKSYCREDSEQLKFTLLMIKDGMFSLTIQNIIEAFQASTFDKLSMISIQQYYQLLRSLSLQKRSQ